MFAKIKNILAKVEEAAIKAVAPNPLKHQEGGEHYKGYAIQPIEFIHANNLAYAEGNVIKYVCRHRQKGGIDDLLKAKHYIDIIISLEYKNQM